MVPVVQPGLEHFQQGDIHNSGQLVGVLHRLHSKDFVPSPSSKPTLFQLKAIPPCPVSTYPCQKSLCSFFQSPLYVLESALMTPQSLLQTEQHQLSQPVFMAELLWPSGSFPDLLWTRSSTSILFLCWGPQGWTQHWGWDVTRAE